MSQDFMAEMQQVFAEEGRQILTELEQAFLTLEADAQGGTIQLPPETIDRVFRLAHNFKGSAASVGFTRISILAHGLEDLLSALKSGRISMSRPRFSIILESIDELRSYLEILSTHPEAERPIDTLLEKLKASLNELEVPEFSSPKPQPVLPGKVTTSERTAPEEKSIRVNTQKLDSLLNLIGELVVNQSMMISHRVNETTDTDHAVQTLVYMEKLVNELQNLAMTLRMVPIKPLFQKMARVVRDASVALEKQVRFVTEGDHVELDKTVLDQMTDPLTHIIRNAADHGIETPQERQAAGKAVEASITLRAEQKDDRIQIIVSDDGKGLDEKRLLQKALDKGLIDANRASDLKTSEIFALIFLPGFSTKDQVTNLSGRGVGMDVVQRAVRDLKGEIEIASTLGHGTRFTISLPLSLSIIPGLVVSANRKNYVIPISQLVEIIEIQKFTLQQSTQRGQMLDLRGEVIPVHELSQVLTGSLQSRDRAPTRYRPGVVISHHGRKVTYEVDEIVGQQQIVIKKLGAEIMGLPGILGGAILSNGEPAMILDLVEAHHPRSNNGGQNAAA